MATAFALLSIPGHQLDCPSCGRSHSWDQDKAWVEGEPEPVEGGPPRMPFPGFSRRRSAEREVQAEVERIDRMFGQS